MAVNMVKITVDGREVCFKASGYSPIAYNMLFPGRDYMKDFSQIQAGSEEMGTENYEAFVRLAYLYAWQALSDSIKVSEEQKKFREKYPDPWEWIDTFGTFSIYEILPELTKLWNVNQIQTAASKNRRTAPRGK